MNQFKSAFGDTTKVTEISKLWFDFIFSQYTFSYVSTSKRINKTNNYFHSSIQTLICTKCLVEWLLQSYFQHVLFLYMSNSKLLICDFLAKNEQKSQIYGKHEQNKQFKSITQVGDIAQQYNACLDMQGTRFNPQQHQ